MEYLEGGLGLRIGRYKDLARSRKGVAIRWLISQIISNNLDLNSQQNQKNAQVN